VTTLFYKERSIIGLDISQTGVKAMAIDAKKGLVTAYGAVDLDPAKVQKSFDGKSLYLAESIQKLLKEKIVGKLPSNHAVVAVPTSRTFSRTFTAPLAAESSLSDAVEIEVDQYIPIPVSSLYIDYEIIERSKDELTVVMSAVPKLLVDSCLSAIKDSGLIPIVIEPSINSVARILETSEEGHLPTLIVDIGAAGTDIAVFDSRAIRVSGGLGIGGNTFTLDIAKKLDVTLENAHQLKVLSGLNAGPRQAKIVSALEPSLQRIVAEIRKVIRYYNERLNDRYRIEQVLVVGAGSNVPGIGDYFTNELVMAARIASPWQKLNFGSLPQPNKQFRPRFITAAGLASVDQRGIWR
jgi:type IV pilus assembly protein PilM